MRRKFQRAEEEAIRAIREAGKPLPANSTAVLPRMVCSHVEAGGGPLKHYMGRAEFIVALTKLAVNFFVLTGM